MTAPRQQDSISKTVLHLPMLRKVSGNGQKESRMGYGQCLRILGKLWINEKFRILPTPPVGYETYISLQLKDGGLRYCSLWGWASTGYCIPWATSTGPIYLLVHFSSFLLLLFPKTRRDQERLESPAWLPSLTALLIVLIYSSYSRWRWMAPCLASTSLRGDVSILHQTAVRFCQPHRQ